MRLSVWIGGVAALALALAGGVAFSQACVSSQFNSEQFACGPPTYACPPGQSCQTNGFCSSTPIDAGLDSHADAAPEIDGEPVADAPLDAPFDVPVFGAPTLVQGVNTPADENTPRVTPSELSMYFQSTRDGGAGGEDLYVATRASTSVAFGGVVALGGVNTVSNETDPMPSPDELTVYFTSNRPSGMAGAAKLWVGMRSRTSLPFSAVTTIAAVESSDDDGQPFLRADGQELWLSSSRLGPSDIFRAPVVDAGFTTPMAVTELNSTFTQWNPYLSTDGLTAFWSTNRNDGNVMGGFDIWTAHRTSLTSPFTHLTPVPGVNSVSDDHMGSVSPDGSRIYFASDRPGGVGSFDIYVAERL